MCSDSTDEDPEISSVVARGPDTTNDQPKPCEPLPLPPSLPSLKSDTDLDSPGGTGCPSLRVSQLVDRKSDCLPSVVLSHSDKSEQKEASADRKGESPLVLNRENPDATSGKRVLTDRVDDSADRRRPLSRDSRGHGRFRYRRPTSGSGGSPDYSFDEKERGDSADDRESERSDSASAFQMIEDSCRSGYERYFHKGVGGERGAVTSRGLMVVQPAVGHPIFPYLCPPGLYSGASSGLHQFPLSPFIFAATGASPLGPPTLPMSYLASAGPELSHLPPLPHPPSPGSLLGGAFLTSSHLFSQGLHSLTSFARHGRATPPLGSVGGAEREASSGGSGRGSAVGRSSVPLSQSHPHLAILQGGHSTSPTSTRQSPSQGGPVFSSKSHLPRYRPFPLSSSSSSPTASPSFSPSFQSVLSSASPLSSATSPVLTSPSTATSLSTSSSSGSSSGLTTVPRLRTSGVSHISPSSTSVLSSSGHLHHGDSARSRSPRPVIRPSPMSRAGLGGHFHGLSASGKTNSELKNIERMLNGLDRSRRLNKEQRRLVVEDE